MAAKSKAELMAETNARRRAEGLVSCVVWIPERERDRLARYVTTYLSGIYVPKPSKRRKGRGS